jgi:hypothetical protein
MAAELRHLGIKMPQTPVSMNNYFTSGEKVPFQHGLINYIDTKAKCRHLKKLTCKGILKQVLKLGRKYQHD